MLSGDDLTQLPAPRLAMLKQLLPPSRTAARFTDESLRVGFIQLPGRTLVCLLNYSDAGEKMTVRLPRPAAVTELWSGEDLGRRSGAIEIEMEAHSGKVLLLR